MDHLAEALVNARGFASRRTSTSTRQSGRSISPKPDPSLCSFCKSEAAAISITKSLTKKTIPLCLVHYYTTKNARIDPKKVSIVDKNATKQQLPYVQDIFAEAFTELQKDILNESARAFNEMSKRGSDPLSILNDHSFVKKSKVQMSKPRAFSTKDGSVSDGGFMRQINKKEVDLIEQQRNRIKTPASNTLHAGDVIKLVQKEKANPYKRRKISSKSSWALVLEGKTTSDDNVPIESNEQTISTCKCGGKGLIFGNTTSRNNDVSKAEIWGTKRDHDVATRFQCQACGKIWNELE